MSDARSPHDARSTQPLRPSGAGDRSPDDASFELEGELIEIDARPSDAIAVAVTCDPTLPIFVNEDVLHDVNGG